MCGQDIEVPESILKFTDPTADDKDTEGDHEAKMFTPGAVMSGCRSWMAREDACYLEFKFSRMDYG